jgi:hypothetical protein
VSVIASADEDGGADGYFRPPPSDALTTKQSPPQSGNVYASCNPVNPALPPAARPFVEHPLIRGAHSQTPHLARTAGRAAEDLLLA